jgi:hypothetical protein
MKTIIKITPSVKTGGKRIKEKKMALYEVDFTAIEPIVGLVEISADPETVREEALFHIVASYPEYEDIEIIEVRKVEDN